MTGSTSEHSEASDDSAVVVDHVDIVEPDLSDEEELSKGDRAVQIVTIDNDDATGHAFHFDRAQLASILDQIPANYKIAIVSVVGAFRTGKSFLLSWFLRYLHAQSKTTLDEPWYQQFQSLGNDGFDWRSGAKRNTTGIWMWNRPHLLAEQKLAVLLMDTQGMFDNETTMALTASIFGFSTLLSSYQIYNVDKRIQEDNLQQLALFSEYARTAMAEDQSEDTAKPFQKMEFLVRDWQHFDEEEDDLETKEESMLQYLDKALEEREAKDLKDTREQIQSCFTNITCYGLCHPGLEVTKNKYTGDVSVMQDLFLRLLDRYCHRVFDPKNLEPKTIHGRQLTAGELLAYTEAYAELFREGTKFPSATTMLEATASANNTNAVNLALAEYKSIMNRIAGPKCSNYMGEKELQEEHRLARQASAKVFDSIANFGPRPAIDDARALLQAQTSSAFEVYQSLNESRNPLAGLETYVYRCTIAILVPFSHKSAALSFPWRSACSRPWSAG